MSIHSLNLLPRQIRQQRLKSDIKSQPSDQINNKTTCHIIQDNCNPKTTRPPLQRNKTLAKNKFTYDIESEKVEPSKPRELNYKFIRLASGPP